MKFSPAPLSPWNSGVPRCSASDRTTAPAWSARSWIISALVCLATLLAVRPARAGQVTDCVNAADLRAQVAAGGLVTFGCNGDIKIGQPIAVVNAVILDGGGASVRLSAQSGSRLFEVATNGSLTVIGLELTGGVNATDGGGAIFNRGIVLLQSCQITGNSATGADGNDGASSNNGGNIGGNGRSGQNGRRIAGGAVFNLGRFRAERCVFEDNTATGGDAGDGGDAHEGSVRGGDGGEGGSGGAALGGAIYSSGVLELYQCEFNQNSAEGGLSGAGGARGAGAFPGVDGRGGKGGMAAGGAIFATNKCFVTIVGCTFEANTVQSGNSSDGGSSKNSGKPGPDGPGAFGGGVCNYGTATVVNSTFADNEIQAGNGGDGDAADVKGGNGGNGGSAWGGSYYNSGKTFMTNCTISGGIARPGTNGLAGAGAYKGRNGSPGATRGANISNPKGLFALGHTILDNPESSSQTSTNHVTTYSTNMIFDVLGKTNALQAICQEVVTERADGTIRRVLTCDTNEITGTNLVGSTNSTITSNLVVNTFIDNRSNAYGAFKDAGFNLLTDKTIKFARKSTSRVNTPADLGPLDNNGGPTRTMEPAGDAIDGGTTNRPPISTDQRGALRPAGDAVDIGAVEVGADFIDPPVITTQPIDFVADPGQDAFFLVAVDGTAPFTYQWYRSPGTALVDKNAAVLTLRAVTNSDAGGYFVVVANRAGSATSRVATLFVNGPPQVLTQPQNASGNVGGAVTLTFLVSGSPAYQWLHDGTNVPGATSSNLVLSSLIPSDAGTYQAIAGNRFGSLTSRVATVTVTVAPIQVLGQPQDYSGYSGRAHTLAFPTTNSSGYQWIFNGAPLVGATNASIVFASVQGSDSGTYQAIATNYAGSVTSRVATISATNSAPIILTAPPASTNVVLGGRLILQASVDGSVPMTNQWYFIDSGFNLNPIAGATSTTLRVENFQAANEGSYTLQILNAFGESFTEPCQVQRP